jgi:hypothetical protein
MGESNSKFLKDINDEISRIGSAFHSMDYEGTAKLCGKIWQKIRNQKGQAEKDARLNIFSYYVDALMKLPNNNQLIETLFNDMRDETTFKMDIKIRALAFELYRVKENIRKAKPIDMKNIEAKGVEIEKECFDVLNKRGRWNLLNIAIVEMKEIFEDWMDSFKRLLHVQKLPVPLELETPVDETSGGRIGFFTKHSLSNDDAMMLEMKIKDESDAWAKKHGKEDDKSPSTEFMINLHKPDPGKMNPLFIKKENIDRWREEVERDEDFRNRIMTLPRISSEHYKLLKRSKVEGQQSLKKLNKELMKLFKTK